MTGIEYGFPLINRDPDQAPVDRQNYHSATNPAVREAVEAQICEEVVEGRYKIVDYKPKIISSLGAIQKPTGKVRLIHDASQPSEGSLNSYAELEEKASFESVQSAVDMIEEGFYLAKIDLKGAYRSVRILPEHRTLAGLRWKFANDSEPVYMVDTRLPFGARLAPIHFHKITQAVKHIMQRNGCRGITVYLDDFLIVAPTYQECLNQMNTLIRLVRKLGFAVAWDKVEGPTTKLTFLGIEIDTLDMELRLPQQKMEAFSDLLQDCCERKRLSLRQLQRLAGKLNWATQIICHGRTYLRILFEAMRGLKHQSHKRTISPELFGALQYWLYLLNSSNGKRLIPGATTLTSGHTTVISQDTTHNNTFGLGSFLYKLFIKYVCVKAAHFWAAQLNVNIDIKCLFLFAMTLNILLIW